MTTKQQTLGNNITVKTEKNIMTITVDLTRDYGFSKSGKTISIASTRGNVRMHDDQDKEIVLGINIYRYPTDDEKIEHENDHRRD